MAKKKTIKSQPKKKTTKKSARKATRKDLEKVRGGLKITEESCGQGWTG